MFTTLVDALLAAAKTDKGIYFIEADGSEDFLPYSELLCDATKYLASFRQMNVVKGDEVVFQFWTLKNFVRAYWACLLGGLVPVPLALAKQSDNANKLFNVWRRLNNPWLVTDDKKLIPLLQDFAEENDAELGSKALWELSINPNCLFPNLEANHSDIVIPAVSGDDIAFIQFSSGSTGEPKGVMLTHTNLLTNIEDLLQSLDCNANDVFLSWKPISHDFGMIAFHIAPVVAAVTQVRIPMETYLWSPVIWFQMVNKYRATVLGSPNFGYRHFLKLYKRRNSKDIDWDLSCVKAIINGAEPISAALCREFTDELQHYGLRPESMRPGYGLAEASLVVSLSHLGDGVIEHPLHREKLNMGDRAEFIDANDPNAVMLVDCGPVFPATEIRITDSDRNELQHGLIGEIEIRGNNVTQGYYNNSEATAQAVDREGWVATGDLGFIHNNRLVFASRLKEMIILAGVNYFPHDIEKAILREKGENSLNYYVACSVPGPKQEGEQLVIFVYYKKDLKDFAAIDQEVRQIVADNFGIEVSYVVPTRNIPKTTSGKVQRFVLRKQFLRGEFDAQLSELGQRRPDPLNISPKANSLVGIKQQLRELVRKECKQDRIGDSASFFELGITSLRLMALRDAIEKSFGLDLLASDILDYPSIDGIAALIEKTGIEQSSTPALREKPSTAVQHDNAVAIVGMSCRFPGGVTSPTQFWTLLTEGVDPVSEMPASRWDADCDGLATRQVGYLENIDQFDPYFFGISPSEAESMDPQQRLLLEVCHEAFENAGCNTTQLRGSNTGVYLGISGSEYASVGRNLGQGTGAYTYTGTMFNSAAGRISYVYGLQGPCIALDTACSSSLTAVHLGVNALRGGNCDQVLAAAVGLMLTSDGHFCFSQMNALSTSGRSRSFDSNADGYIRSEGCAAVVLKRLEDAQRDGDTVYAIIRGSAINHNGRSGGLTVPSGTAQESLIRAALSDAGIAADNIDYVEAHGSGTRLGDPQEASALNRVFSERQRPLYIGAVKSNIGHLEAVAGLAGLQKVALSLAHNRVPPNLHFDQPNPLIDWKNSPLHVVDRNTEFKSSGGLRYAGITSLGISGSNAHLVLESGLPSPDDSCVDRELEQYLVTLSAKSEAGLHATLANFAKADLSAHSIARLSRATQFQRSHYAVRYACLAKDIAQLQSKLSAWLERHSQIQTSKLAAEANPPLLVFMFTGQGSHYVGMARELYLHMSQFSKLMDRCSQAFRDAIGIDLIAALYGENSDALQDTLVAQAVIFSVEYALARLWLELGVEPDLVLGHSIGEYAAACFCGVMTLDQAVAMVVARGRAMKNAPQGAMIGVLAEESKVKALIEGMSDIYIAAVNAPVNVTVSGSSEAVEKFSAKLKSERIFTEALAIRQPYHSPLMATVVADLKPVLDNIHFNLPERPLISTQLGRVVDANSPMNADYWCQHLCQPVNFTQALQAVDGEQGVCFVEIGGTATLSGLAAQIFQRADYQFLPSLREGRGAWTQWNESLAQVYKAGVDIDWESYHGGRSPVLQGLPNTGFARTRYWFKDAAISSSRQQLAVTATSDSATAVISPTTNSVTYDVATIERELIAVIAQVTGVAEEELHADLNLFSLGVDSLMLVQLDKRIQSRYAVEISLAQFFSELHTPAKLASHIDQTMTSEARQALQAPTLLAAPAPLTAQVASGDGNILLSMQQQLDAIQKQLANLGAPAPRQVSRSTSANKAGVKTSNLRDIVLEADDLTDQQHAFVASMTKRLIDLTPNSKTYAQNHRQKFADWIATLNFTLSTKEFTYPLVAQRSSGSRFWDTDGNEYIDTAMGYGVCLFGHNPSFVTSAIQAQLSKGMELGPQSALAGEVAERICEMTGAERVAFANTGSEAVMVAIRLARSVTKRNKVVRFVTSFHGSFDGILAEMGEDGATPMASGIVPSMVQDTLVMQYASDASLQQIADHANDIAAVLVEPVQSRNPGLQPAAYLRRLRKLTEEHGIALIFDEMITGFRIHPGGAQAYFGVKADIATYGKIVGGGMPIGVVAGKKQYMDAIDGGYWRFGDNSGPGAETTFFAGTFCKHPLTMAAALAVLRKLKERGPALQEQLNNTTLEFRDRLNALFARKQVPITVKSFASMYRFESGVALDMPRHSLEMNLFFRLLQLQGVYVWERRTCFVSTAHSAGDLDIIYQAVDSAIDQLRGGGFSFRRMEAGQSDASFAVSSEESRMFVLSQMQGGDLAYRISGALRIRGELDCERLQRALDALTQRHEALRSNFVMENGEIRRQVVNTQQAPALIMQTAEPNIQLVADREPFNLQQGPLWRVRILQLGQGEHILHLEFNHLIADGMSMSILVEELAQYYNDGEFSGMPASYKNFVTQEAQYLKTAKYSDDLSYWREHFANLPEPLQLPTDRPRSPINDFAGESYRFVVNQEVTSQVHSSARKLNTTPFVALLATWFGWLGKVSQQSDICVGVPFDRRGNEFERTLGMFAQTLAIRGHMQADVSFAQLSKQVAKDCAMAFSHSNVPLEKIIESSGIARDLSRNPLFDTLFIYESGQRRYQSAGELSFEPVAVYSNASAFDLTLEITEQAGELHVQMIYATRLFSRDRIVAWANDFTRYLSQAMAQPEKTLATLGEMDADEVNRIESFHGQSLSIVEESVIDAFIRLARQSPDSEALRASDRRLTYQQLLAEVEKLSRHLLMRGVKSGDRVAVLLPRDSHLIISLLAVLRCGACYVPLDPEYPPRRLQHMLDHAGIGLLIARSDLAAGLAYRGELVDPSTKLKSPRAATFPMVSPEQLAYVIYTSGSTGTPKGVMVNHHGLTNFVVGIAEAVKFNANSLTLGLTTVSFDIFVLEVFVTLTRLGGCLVLANEEQQKDPHACAKLIAENKVNVVQMTPSRLQVMLAGQDARKVFAGVECLLIGGEAFPSELLQTLQNVEGLRIFNVYGPTEATVWATYAELTHATTVTLGKPLPNVQAYVLGPQQQRLPIGNQGELYLAGDCLASGYLFDQERTNDAFVANPFAQGELMYRTGDMVSWTTQGELTYHGRRDHQVKLRGYRIELPEIEKALTDLDEVLLGAVVVRELSRNNPVLVAFYTSSLTLSEVDIDNRIRDQLRSIFPDYMLPAVICKLDNMPLTPNGKIDRNRLPHTVELPTIDHFAQEEIEDDALLVEIRNVWKQLLGDRQLNRHSSFFDVGGNSFSLLMMQAEFNKRWPGLVQVPDLFANPNIQMQRDLIAKRLQGQIAEDYAAITGLEGFWCVNHNKSSHNAHFAVEADSELLPQIKRFSKENNVSERELLIGVFAVYLNKKLSLDSINLYSLTQDASGYLPLQFVFSKLGNVEDVLRAVQRQVSATAHFTAPPSMEQRDGALILFKSISQPLNNRLRRFDLQISLSDGLSPSDRLLLRVDFDQNRVNQALVRDWINDYLRLLNILLSHSQERVSA